MSERDDHADPADLAEQAAPLRDEDPDDLDDLVVDTSDPEVDDADRWEQATPVGGDDEDYPEGGDYPEG
jgi:hypothetical protein